MMSSYCCCTPAAVNLFDCNDCQWQLLKQKLPLLSSFLKYRLILDSEKKLVRMLFDLRTKKWQTKAHDTSDYSHLSINHEQN
jgi:hypothetical protein